MKQKQNSIYVDLNPKSRADLISTTASSSFNNVDAMLNHLSKEYSVTLSTEWTQQSSGAYSKSVTINDAGLTSSSNVIVDVKLSLSDIDADIEVLTAWGNINNCVASNNTLTFYAYSEAPTIAIPLTVVISR